MEKKSGTDNPGYSLKLNWLVDPGLVVREFQELLLWGLLQPVALSLSPTSYSSTQRFKPHSPEVGDKFYFPALDNYSKNAFSVSELSSTSRDRFQPTRNGQA